MGQAKVFSFKITLQQISFICAQVILESIILTSIKPAFELIRLPSGAYRGKTSNVYFQYPQPSVFPIYREFKSRRDCL